LIRPRVIPCLLLQGEGLVKTIRFQKPKYVGDPINAVKLFNDLEVDELVFLDITATLSGRGPNFDRILQITSECFMPLGYGGGIRSVDDARRLLNIGIEKVIVNTAAARTPALITEMAKAFGSQSIVVAIDIKRDWLGRQRVVTDCGTHNTRIDPVTWASEAERLGAGELFVNSIDRDGTMTGYDLALVETISKAVRIPVIACGGAGSAGDLRSVIMAGASAAAAGSIFVFKGPHRAVLINYLSKDDFGMLSQL
jgi:imidazole glycerol-phosphate synthase subunit HisF